MGTSQTHALGRNRKFFAKAESTYGTFIVPTATDAVKALTSSFTFQQARENRMDSRTTRSLLERYSGKKTVSWSSEHYIIPSGSAGTAPDCGVLLKAAMGTETVSGGVSVAYTLSDSQTALTGVSLVHYFNDVFMEAIKGGWVEGVQISGKGGDAPRIKFEGGGADCVTTGTSTTNGATSGSTVTVQTADADNFDVDSVIKVGTSDNSGVGHKVTAKSGATLTVSGTPAMGNGVAVIPFVPDETTTGSVLGGIAGSFEIDNTAIATLTEFEVNIKNGIKPINDEALNEKVSDFIVGYREVSGSVTLRGRSDMIKYHAMRRTDITDYKPIEIVIGTTAGKILTISIPRAEFNPDGVDAPDADEITIKLPFVGLASSATAADEITLTFT
jgi:hypothetical protein